jgi:hypothetical protein
VCRVWKEREERKEREIEDINNVWEREQNKDF